MKIILVLVATLAAAGPAAAQYYERPPPPPPGYYPPPYERREDRREEPRFEPRYEPRYERRDERPFGDHCEAFFRTDFGPRRLFCPIVDPKPLGEECACPPPREFGEGPFVRGRTVR